MTDKNLLITTVELSQSLFLQKVFILILVLQLCLYLKGYNKFQARFNEEKFVQLPPPQAINEEVC